MDVPARAGGASPLLEVLEPVELGRLFAGHTLPYHTTSDLHLDKKAARDADAPGRTYGEIIAAKLESDRGASVRIEEVLDMMKTKIEDADPELALSLRWSEEEIRKKARDIANYDDMDPGLRAALWDTVIDADEDMDLELRAALLASLSPPELEQERAGQEGISSGGRSGADATRLPWDEGDPDSSSPWTGEDPVLGGRSGESARRGGKRGRSGEGEQPLHVEDTELLSIVDGVEVRRSVRRSKSL